MKSSLDLTNVYKFCQFAQPFLIRLMYDMPRVSSCLVAKIGDIDIQPRDPTIENCAVAALTISTHETHHHSFEMTNTQLCANCHLKFE